MIKKNKLALFLLFFISLIISGSIDGFALYAQNPDKAVALVNFLKLASRILKYAFYIGLIPVVINGFKYLSAWKNHKNQSETQLGTNNNLDSLLQLNSSKIKFQNILYIDVCLKFLSSCLSEALGFIFGGSFFVSIIPVIVFGASVYIWATKDGTKASGILILYLLYKIARLTILRM